MKGFARYLPDRTFWFVFAAAIVPRFLFLFFTADDAYITFRHVANMLDGQGLVYNPGERVLGVSSPLYALVLCALGMVGLDFVFWGKILGIVAGSFACGLLYRILRSEEGEGAALIAGLLAASFSYLVVWSASGMETGVALALSLLSVWLYCRGNLTCSGIALGLSVLTRFDALLLGMALLSQHMVKQRRVPRRLIVWSAIVVTPWLLFSIAYYGTMLPSSVIAKALVYRGTPEATEFLDKMKVLFGKPDKLAFSMLVAWGFIRAVRSMKTLMVLCLWSVLHFVSLLVSEGCIFPWYYCPIFPGYLALGAVGIVQLCRWLSRRMPRHGRQVYVGAALCLLAISTVRLAHSWNVHYPIQREMTNVHKAIGCWLKRETPQNTTVLVGDIGYIGYYSERHILDWMGLVSPELLPYHRNRCPERVVLDYRPDCIVLGEYDFLYSILISQEWFANMYQEASVFEEGAQAYHVWLTTTHGNN